MHPLNQKEKRFVELYVGQCNGNATEAAKLAGYSKVSAHVLGHRLLKKVKIRKAIDAFNKKRETPQIATARERDELRTEFLRDTSTHKSIRLKAGEALDKVDRLNKANQAAGTSLADLLDAALKLSLTDALKAIGE